MALAESLYMSGIISYPRTESTAYPEDGADLAAAIAQHSSHAVWGGHAAALVATIGEGDDEVIIGAGGYTVLDRSGELPTAEVSFTIEEDYQGQGLSGLFMRLLTQIARERGLRRFEAEVLAGNTAMLKVFQRSGLPMTKQTEDGVVHVVMDLDAASPG